MPGLFFVCDFSSEFPAGQHAAGRHPWSQGLIGRGKVAKRIFQRAEMLFVAPPALHGCLIDRLAGLAVAERQNRPRAALVAQAGLVPRQTGFVDQLPACGLRI